MMILAVVLAVIGAAAASAGLYLFDFDPDLDIILGVVIGACLSLATSMTMGVLEKRSARKDLKSSLAPLIIEVAVLTGIIDYILRRHRPEGLDAQSQEACLQYLGDAKRLARELYDRSTDKNPTLAQNAYFLTSELTTLRRLISECAKMEDLLKCHDRANDWLVRLDASA